MSFAFSTGSKANTDFIVLKEASGLFDVTETGSVQIMARSGKNGKLWFYKNTVCKLCRHCCIVASDYNN